MTAREGEAGIRRAAMARGTQMGKKSMEEFNKEKELNDDGRKKKSVMDPSFLSYATIAWIWPVLQKGKAGTLTLEDLPIFAVKNRAASLELLFQPFWKELARHHEEPVVNKKPDLLVHLLYILRWRIVSIILWNSVWTVTLLAYPLLLQQMIIFIQDADIPNETGIYIVVGLVISVILKTFAWNIKDMEVRAGQQILQAILSSAIVRKEFKQKYKMENSEADSINMIDMYVPMISGLLDCFIGISSIIYVLVDIYLLYRLVGLFPAIGGAICIFILTGITSFLSIHRSMLAGEYAKVSKEKLALLRGFIQGATVAKFLGLEEDFQARDAKLREKTSNIMSNHWANISFANSLGSNYVGNVSSVVFAVFVLSGNILTASIAFPAMLFMDLGEPALQINALFGTFKSVSLGIKKISEYLLTENVASKSSTCHQISKELILDSPSWELGQFKLSIPKVRISQGFTGIFGEVGSGKTTLLKGILGLVPKVSGNVRFHGSISYAPQRPILIRASVKENITYFSDFVDHERLQEVVKCCQLERDLNCFNDGLDTIVLEQGVNLSGGQKARISLARALYRDADVYCFDDPLSSCDANVSRRIFANLKSFLKEKKVLFVSHSLKQLSQMESIIYLENGMITEFGPCYDELQKGETGIFSKLLNSGKAPKVSDHDELQATRVNSKSDNSSAARLGKEESEEVTLETWKSYSQNLSNGFIAVLVVVFILNTAGYVGAPLWLTNWSTSQDSQAIYLPVYISLAVGASLTKALACMSYFTANQRIANSQYDRAINSIFHASVSFFHQHSSGQIINRICNDVVEVDRVLGLKTTSMFTYSVVFIAITILVCISNPYLIIFIIAIYFLAHIAFKYVGGTSVTLRRFQAISTSNVLTVLNESLNGSELIRVFNVEEEVMEKFHLVIDRNLATQYVLASTSIWFDQRLALLSLLLVFSSCVTGFYVRGNSLHAAFVALALNYCSLIGVLAEAQLRSFASASSSLNAYQRLTYYGTKLPQEAARQLLNDPSKEVWPFEGAIEFKSLTMAYEQSPEINVVKEVSLRILPGEKIGVVGRTGAGKSTLIGAIFRLMEAKEGSIIVDGLDISTLGLYTLRKRIQIVPQESILFQGTIRSNITMVQNNSSESEKTKEDIDVWHALYQVGLKEYVTSLEGGLDAKVSTDGGNFSQGQRQLLCLARAIIFKPKILIMDETTASVDTASDERIQKLLKTQFNDTTVICIAHRIASVSEYDRIMVLSDGRLVEFDSPSRLLKNPLSLYSELVLASGQNGSSELIGEH